MELFEQTFVGTGTTKKTWTVMLAFIGQIVFLVILVIIPMVWFDVLPMATLTSFLVAPPPPPPPPPPPAAAPVVVKVKIIPRQFDAGRLMAPKVIPKEIAIIKEEELPPSSGVGGVVGGVPGGVPGGTMGGVLGGIIGSVPSATPLPPPPPVKKDVAATPQRIKVGGNVQQAMLISQPHPLYPPLAKQARIQGVVELNAVIGKDGTVQNLSVVKGHPLLVQAALDAVKQWRYKPTLLNGEPVEVQTTIDVNFTLSQ